MEGPTPVSALIHAATMVTAGVYMCTRSAVIFTHAPAAMETVAIIGLATAVFAATIGLLQNDIKKVYAYSTVSQLGYMFLGVGVGAFSAGIWHLVTHAFFKALLFLGAGSVIHACHGEQDMRHMGGLWKYAKGTALTLICASLAISGFPFTAGYYSKDAILGAAYGYAPWMYWVGVVTAGMTAFYVWRAFWMTFYGRIQGTRTSARIAMVDARAAGGAGDPFDRRRIPLQRAAAFWTTCSRSPKAPENMTLTYISVAFGLGGIALSYYMYVVNPGTAESASRPLSAVSTT